jgi:hypothetical protein
MKKHITIVGLVHAGEGIDDHNFFRADVDQEMWKRILLLQGLAKEHGLVSLRFWDYSADIFDKRPLLSVPHFVTPELRADEDMELVEDPEMQRKDCMTLCVSDDDFFWRGIVKHTDVRWETDSIMISDITPLWEGE